MFFKTVINCGLVFIFTLILILPFADLLDEDEDDNTEVELRLKDDKNTNKRDKLREDILSDEDLNDGATIKSGEENSTTEMTPPEVAARIDYSSSKNSINQSFKVNNPYNDKNNVPNNMNNYYGKNHNDLQRQLQIVVSNIIISVQFRENVLRAFGYLLQVAGTSLTEEQYTALHLIYTALREKRVYFFDLLPPIKSFLPNESVKGRNSEMETVLKILSMNLPRYLKCTAHFLVKEVHYNNINIQTIVSANKAKPQIFNFFFKIDTSDLTIILNKNEIINLEVKPTDKETSIIEATLGRIFVNIINKIYEKKIPLTQPVFAVILVNLPISPLDPVLEENILYVYELGINNNIPNWNNAQKEVNSKDPYFLIRKMLINLLKVQEGNHLLINAITHIFIHLHPPIKTLDNSAMIKIDETDKKFLIILLQSIVYPEFDRNTILAKKILINMIERPDFNIKVIPVVTKFVYEDPLDLLLAILTNLHRNVVEEPKYREVAQIVPVLISSLIFKKQTIGFSPVPSKELRVLDLLPWMSMQGPKFVDISKVIDNIIIKDDEFRSVITNSVTKSKEICFEPKQCLLNIFKESNQRVPNEIKIMVNQISGTSPEDKSVVNRPLQTPRPPPTMTGSPPNTVQQAGYPIKFPNENEYTPDNNINNNNININSNINNNNPNPKKKIEVPFEPSTFIPGNTDDDDSIYNVENINNNNNLNNLNSNNNPYTKEKIEVPFKPSTINQDKRDGDNDIYNNIDSSNDLINLNNNNDPYNKEKIKVSPPQPSRFIPGNSDYNINNNNNLNNLNSNNNPRTKEKIETPLKDSSTFNSWNTDNNKNINNNVNNNNFINNKNPSANTPRSVNTFENNQNFNENSINNVNKIRDKTTTQNPINFPGSLNLHPSQIIEMINELLKTQQIIPLPSNTRLEANNIKTTHLCKILRITLEQNSNRLPTQKREVFKYYVNLLTKVNALSPIVIRQADYNKKVFSIDFKNLMFEVINIHLLPQLHQLMYYKILKYLESNLDIINSSNIDLFKYETKGVLVQYILEQFIKNNNTKLQIKNYIRVILQYIQRDGPGATKMQFDGNVNKNVNVNANTY